MKLYQKDKSTITETSMVSRKSEILRATDEAHKEMMDLMRGFFDNGKPQVGIFWYDYANNKLFGVQKDDADKYAETGKIGTLHKLHKTYWTKQHFRAVANNETNSIFYSENNYTLIPRGRIFVKPDMTFYVTVGEWINGQIDGKEVIDKDKLRELIEDEFNLTNFDYLIDEHWNIGRVWSEDRF